MHHRVIRAFVAAIAVVVIASPAVAQNLSPDQSVTVSFSDTSRPGSLRVDLIAGSITVKGTGRRDVLVSTSGGDGDRRRRQASPPPEPGFRRLNQPAPISIKEERNTMIISSEGMSTPANFEIEVPARTNLRLSTVNGSQISVDGVEGDMEIQNVNGSVTVTNVAGSVLASTTNGAVKATLTRVTAGKPMAFTSLNGQIDVTLPASMKADVKLRSDNGEVLTDFDIQLKPGPAPTVEDTRNNRGGRYRVELNQAVYGTINGGGPEIELRTFNGRVILRKGP
jgi:hypothetical protein